MTDRLGRLLDVAAAMGAEAAVVTHPANRHYFSGFPAEDHAPDESSGIMLVSQGAVELFVSPTNRPKAEAAVHSSITVRPWVRPWQSFVAKRFREIGVRRVLFEDHAMNVFDHAAVLAAAEDVELIPAGSALQTVRAIKESEELESITEAARITDAAFLSATTGLAAGVTERELAWRLESAMRELGANGSAFPTSVASGPHAARPHHDATNRALEAGEPIVIDLGAVYNGYSADLTRTIVIGDPSSAFIERYAIVLDAERSALSGIRPGMTGRASDQIARDVIIAAGYGDNFVHGLGHGVGLLIHEYPSLGVSSEDHLEPDHVVTIEPGIYLEGWGGIRIEDLCVVTQTGLDVLSKAPK